MTLSGDVGVGYSGPMDPSRQSALDAVTPAIRKLELLQQTFATGAEYDKDRLKETLGEIGDDLKSYDPGK